MNGENSRGQVLLITLLVLSIAMTVALSLIGRTTTDLNISNDIEESARAFSAAEAGIEEALRTGGQSTGVFSGTNVAYSATVTSIGGATGPYVFPKKTSRTDTETVWLVNHDASGDLDETRVYASQTIEVCWSAETTTPAVLVTILYKIAATSSYHTAKLGFDPVSARALQNNFSNSVAVGTYCGTANMYRAQIDFSALGIAYNTSDILLAARIRPLYSDATLAVEPVSGITLPEQGRRIESTGTTPSGIQRKIIVYQQYKAAGTAFDHAIYSQGAFTK